MDEAEHTKLVFPLPTDERIVRELESKRHEYLNRINDPEAPWAHIRDLYIQYFSDAEWGRPFRVLYYTFYLLSQILLAAEHTANTTPAETGVKARWLKKSIGMSFNNLIYTEEFDEACEAVRNLLKGEDGATPVAVGV